MDRAWDLPGCKGLAGLRDPHRGKDGPGELGKTEAKEENCPLQDLGPGQMWP